jgi:hypothetical protein
VSGDWQRVLEKIAERYADALPRRVKSEVGN